MSSRAGIVITGTEVLTGRVQDRNGPWLADQLLELGVELAHITICGDRSQDIEAQLRFLASEGVDLIVTSGGLGPTADDITVATVARFCGREVALDAELEQTISDILKAMVAGRAGVDFDAVLAANRKQAMVPVGAEILTPVGTAPGVVVPGTQTAGVPGTPTAGVPGTPTVVVLPGPPRELQPMWAAAVQTAAVQRAIAGRTVYRQETVRMFGLPESGLAETLREGEKAIDGFERLEITTCLRRGELEIVTRYEPDAADVYTALVGLLRDRHGRELFSTDGAFIDDQIAGLLAGRTIATAESCTAGMIAARLTDRPGSSDYVAGGVVSYSNEAKVELLGVDPALLEAHGAVSEPVAEAMAAGALKRFGADTAVSTTGIAGPGGGSQEKPVGTVCFCVMLADGRTVTRTLRLPGNRSDVRERSTTVAMHLLRRALSSDAD
ncbi:competence/damage-inducible protein A [Mycolicibacterium sp. P9-64]|uniref:competence/damage-inducible protein A n=1 Tax=Mycolicibacterium sp. P9-64 TaxID=2024612 RepID=UPI0011F05BB5|nr:competence/damage-inducible protein A [Mycolicibacterium sp. P9-64]KAA0081893.1 competence/damage-inducible protein A [Mycolicibacterium sp. P9-64]